MTDQLEIQNLIARYSRAVDTRNWDDLDEIFTPDASIDYTAMGGIKGGVAEVKAYLAETFAPFGPTQHMMGLPDLRIDGDRATAVTPCNNPMVLKEGDHPMVMLCALNYHETFVRTADGWRIDDLREERVFMRLLPK